MKTKLLLFTALFLIGLTKLLAQSADEEAIKKTVRTETESFFKRDTTTWKASFVQNEKVTGNYVNPYAYSHYAGWKKFGVPFLEWVAKNPKPIEYKEFKNDNYLINVYDNVATVEYDQVMDLPYGDSLSPYQSHEIRTLVKEDGQWKILSLISIDTSINSSNAAAIENRVNAVGYQLLSAKRIKDAIDIFKMNVKFFPNSWNVYDSLGEAYMDDGDNANAVTNYEMSIKLNPKNDNGQQMLTKLKNK